MSRISLRLRLLLIVVVLAGGVLVAVNVVTYTSLRSFLVDRDSEQLIEAVGGVDRQLEATSQGSRRMGATGDAPAPPPPISPGARGSEPGTYGALLDAQGNVTRTLQLNDGDTVRPPPRLPTSMAGISKASDPVEVDAVSGGGRYLMVARTQAADHSQFVVAAIPLDSIEEILDELRVIEGAATITALLLIIGLGAWSIRVGLRPLDRIGRTASTIAAGDLTQRVEPTTERTEVGRLGIALNTMLAQIERAFSEREASELRMRQFLADASHELRTPLASIRGYAEVFRLGAAEDPEDLARSLERIEHSAARMGVLVDDLLLLARLDAVRRVDGVPVDLGAIVDDACGDVRVTAKGRSITYTGPPGDESVTVVADADQVYQIVDNLLRNALVHTPPDTAIAVSVAERDGRGVLTVRDYGPGLSQDAVAHVFERFWRGDPSREQQSAGAGLGLAIVQAIVTAHGGSARASNAPGGGARFEIELRLAPPMA